MRELSPNYLDLDRQEPAYELMAIPDANSGSELPWFLKHKENPENTQALDFEIETKDQRSKMVFGFAKKVSHLRRNKVDNLVNHSQNSGVNHAELE